MEQYNSNNSKYDTCIYCMEITEDIVQHIFDEHYTPTLREFERELQEIEEKLYATD